MSGQVPPNPNSSSPLDKLSKDVAQYQKAQSVGKQPVGRPQAAPAPQPAPAAPPPPVQVKPQAAPAGPAAAWQPIDRNLGSQITLYLLIAGYSVLMLAAGTAVMFLLPSGAALWPVMVIGVVVSMIASHKGRPPLLWFMYGSVVPMAPLLAAAGMALVGGAASAAASGLGILNLGLGQGGAAGQPTSTPSTIDLFLCVCVVGLIPLVHVLLAERDVAGLEARQLAAGMKRCAACAEIIRPEAKLCRYCGQEQVAKS